MMLVYQLTVLMVLVGFMVGTLLNLRVYRQIPLADDLDLGQAAILVPARNEAANIGECLGSLLLQDYTNFTVYVLDDQSEDETPSILHEIAGAEPRVVLLSGAAKPSDWAGKVWACSQLGARALEDGAEWLLFLDADTRARPSLLSSLIFAAKQKGASMATTFPMQVTGTFWEWVAMPVLHFLITTFLPIALVMDSKFPTVAAGCGQVELFTRESYVRTGGHTAVKWSFHDGLQLARHVKREHLVVLLCDASHLVTCRMYKTGKEVWNGFVRNAYEGLGSVGALITVTSLTLLFFVFPYAFLLCALALKLPSWGWLCFLQVMVIIAIRLLQAKRFGHISSVILHPLSMLMLVAVQWTSFWRHLRGSSTDWKGRKYGPGSDII